MARQYTVTLSPNKQATKLDVVQSLSVEDPATNEVYVAVGDGVSLNKQVEILNALRMLANGIKDGRFMDQDFAGGSIVTVVDIANVASSNRRFSSTLAAVSFTPTDVVVGFGSGLRDLLGNQYLLIINIAITVCIQSLLEDNK